MDIKIKTFFESTKNWREELLLLRSILIDLGLDEQYKWRVPCYLHDNKNIALVSGFKSYCAIGFFKGSLLKDDDKLLVAQTANVQSSRLLTFHSLEEIIQKKATIEQYVKEAVNLEKAGLKVAYKTTQEFSIPIELEQEFKKDKELREAFQQLTQGRQRGYLLHFAGAKQSSTRTERIVKCRSRIMMGKGLNDCICGKSNRMPNCDGSHKF